MSQQISEIRVSFQLKTCKCTRFEFTEFGKKNNKEIPTGTAQYTISVSFDVNEKEKTITVKLSTSVVDNPKSKNELFKIDSLHEFQFKEATNVFIKNGDQVLVPNVLLISLYSVCLSNHRGMAAVKLENSIYENIIFPIIDASQFIPKPPASFG